MWRWLRGAKPHCDVQVRAVPGRPELSAADQRRATAFLRAQLKPHLGPARWQHQPHDHVLRDEERKRGAFATTCFYVAENPVRAVLAAKATE